MKEIFKIHLLLLALALSGCGGDAPAPGGTAQVPVPIDTAATANPSVAPSNLEPARPNCKLTGSVMEGNMFWAAGIGRLVVISAEKETEDPTLGESHRVLTVYDGQCSQVFRQVLPVNLSADFPYYLSEITYNKVSQQAAIRGADKLYVLDLNGMKLHGPLVPKFLNERYVEDARSGNIERLELWENYLVGYAASMGPFVFDLSDPAKPAAVLPTAEFALIKGEQYNSMFLLKSSDADDGYQAMSPDYDYDKEAFSLNVLFDKPTHFDPVLNKSYRNNRYILLKEKIDGGKPRPHAIDMKERRVVELPTEIASKKDTEILAWLKGR